MFQIYDRVMLRTVGDDFLVYNQSTNETMVLNKLACAILEMLNQAAAIDAGELQHRISVLTEYSASEAGLDEVRGTLQHLVNSGLVLELES